jgi:hypothetical protein
VILANRRPKDDIPEGIPAFADTGYMREKLLDDLRDEVTLPERAVTVAAQFPAEIEPAMIDLLARAQTEEMDGPSARLLVRGLHILGAARCPGIYRPMIAFLRSPPDHIQVLGDTLTETLSQILAGVFDGDIAPLLALMTDNDADEWARNAAFGTLAFLAFDGRVPRETAEDFLRRFERVNAAPSDSIAWYGWMKAVGLLGVAELSPQVHAGFEDGRIPADVDAKGYYRRLLDAALQRPNDVARFHDENLGYIEDVVAELSAYITEDEGEFDPAPAAKGLDPVLAREMNEIINATARRAVAAIPVHNKWRGVGRNDPCPCGSGKKFKKCCMPQ